MHIKYIKFKKAFFGVSLLATSFTAVGLLTQNLNRFQINQNNLLSNQSLAVPASKSNSIYYPKIDSSVYKTQNNLIKQYNVDYRDYAGLFVTHWTNQGWKNSKPNPYDNNYRIIGERTVVNNFVQLLQISYSDSLIQEQIPLPINPKDWANQKYTINTNWTGGFWSNNKTSYTINASPGQQVFTVEDSNIDGYNPATDAGNSGNGDDGFNVDPAGYHGGRDGLRTEIVIDKSITGNVLTANMYLRATTVNRGDGNKYYWDGLGPTTITVNSITPALNDISDNDFNNGLQKALLNLSYVSDWSNSVIDTKNWTDIQRFITSKITSYVDSVNKKQNYQKTFNVDYNLTNSTANTINLTIYYDSLKGSSATITTAGTNQYQTAFNLNVPVKMLLSDKYYGNEAWNNLTFDTNKINYDENTGQISISSNTDIEKSNPWYNLIKAPTPASNQIYTTGPDSPTHPVYPNFGTFYLDHEINITYKVKPNEKGDMYIEGSGPGVSISKKTADVGNGIYTAIFYDGRFEELKQNGKINPADINKPTIWTLYIKGNKNGVYGLQMQMTFVIDAYSPSANISYKGWDPSVGALPWQKQWITQTLDNGKNNPVYKPILDPKTGLGQEVVWLDHDLDPKRYLNGIKTGWSDQYPFSNINLGGYNNYPDPIDNNGKLMYYAGTKNADKTVTPNQNSANINFPIDSYDGSYTSIPTSSYGFIANAYVSPKGINEFVQPNQELYKFTLTPELYTLRGAQPPFNPTFISLRPTNAQKVINNTNPDLDYNDKTGIYLYVTKNLPTKDNPNPTYTNTVVAIDPAITSQNFSEYIEQKLKEDEPSLPVYNAVSYFWSSLAGQHLADFLFNVQGMKNDQIIKLSYSQIVSYWNIYIKNAVLLNENSVTPKYNLNDLALASIKSNTNNADDLKNQVLTNLQDQMNHLADRLTIKKKADLAKVNKGYLWDETRDAVSLIYGQDYYIANLDSINWNSLANLNKTTRQQTINLNVVATTPNANLVAGSSTNLKVINSLDFNNLYNLFNAQIPAWNANTNSLDVLKQGISDNVNAYLSTATGKTITNSDWYIKESDSELSNDLLPSGSKTIQIVASDSSPYLINSTTITVNNQTTNPFDLRNIQIPKLNINSDDKGIIWQSIYNWVKEYVSKNYSNLLLDTDYKIQISDADINAIIDSFNKNSGDYTINQVLIPINDKTQGYTNLVVNDAKENELINNVAPIPGSNNPYVPQTPTSGNGTNNPNGPSGVGDVDSGNQGYFSNKSNIAWVSTVATIGGIILIILIYGFIVRQMDNAETLSGIFFKRKNRKYWQQRALEDAEYQRKSDLGIEDDDEVIDYYDEGESDFSKGWTEFKRRFMPKRYAKQQAMKEQEEREQEEYLKRAKESFEKAKRDKDPFTPEEREELERLKAIAREERLRLKMEREIKEKGLSEEYED